jgi:O-acetyl-ADP-ribose deacetylase (regulator of RNase III)
MIEVHSGDLLSADVEALVNTVNTVGVMGKGLALQFKQRFPVNCGVYAAACKRGEVEIGRMLVVETRCAHAGSLSLFAKLLDKPTTEPRYIINFPTKKHWREPSQITYVQTGLTALVEEVRMRNIRSIAVPPLGCGNGGLTWSDVEPVIKSVLSVLASVRILLFTPNPLKSNHYEGFDPR